MKNLDSKEQSNEKIDYNKIRKVTKAKIVIGLLIVLGANGIIAYGAGSNFNQIFKTKSNVKIVAHRGGGIAGPENTVEGLREAIKLKANYSEIDDQGTKDGKYIINHDKNFERLTGNSSKPVELTLDEIKNLRIKDDNTVEKSGVRVSTLEEFLDTAKGKIGLFV